MQYVTKEMIGRKRFQRFTYPRDMDEEMVDLMDVINNIPGCRTAYSCQGHGYGGWYFTVFCSNETAVVNINQLFTRRGCEIIQGSSSSIITGSDIPEHEMSIYDKQFDKQTASQKKKAYVEMCNFLIKFIPDETWWAPKGKRTSKKK